MNPVELLQTLIRFDTTNPPGNEAACVNYINDLLQSAGIETQIIARDPNRPNLIARLPGENHVPPLMLYGHVDVVTTENQDWDHPPFSGDILDGYVWGRGALDMKGGITMLLTAFLRAKVENLSLPLMLVILSDEEVGSAYGAKFLVEEHTDLFKGIRHAIGEFGGFTQYIGDKCFYPIGVAEKQGCSLRAIVRGKSGHGALPLRGGAAAKLGHLLITLDQNRLPVHVTPVVRQMIEEMATALAESERQMMLDLLDPAKTDAILDQMGERGRRFDALLHNTVNATIIHGGSKINVIPGEITVDLDGRLVPGFKPEDMIAELHALIGEDIELQVLQYDPGQTEIDMSLFETLAGVIKAVDPTGIPTPLVLSGVTDGRFFARLGIQTYGFLPMTLPDEMNFTGLIHAANERIPVDALHFGVDTLYRALQKIAERNYESA